MNCVISGPIQGMWIAIHNNTSKHMHISSTLYLLWLCMLLTVQSPESHSDCKLQHIIKFPTVVTLLVLLTWQPCWSHQSLNNNQINSILYHTLTTVPNRGLALVHVKFPLPKYSKGIPLYHRKSFCSTIGMADCTQTVSVAFAEKQNGWRR